MTTEQELEAYFEAAFKIFEKNRVYPPTQRRIPMFTVNDSHLRAIARAVHFVRSGMTTQMTPKLLNDIQHDIDLLDEAHKYIRQQIMEPGLAMSEIPDAIIDVGKTIAKSTVNNGEKHGDTDKKS